MAAAARPRLAGPLRGGALYNDETITLYEASCLARGSLQRGRVGDSFRPDTVAGYGSALRAFLSRDGGVDILVPEVACRGTAFRRAARRSSAPGKPRRKRRGMRARHLAAAAANASFDRTSSWLRRRRWLCAVSTHVLVARGGEMGRVKGKAFTRARGLT